MKMSDREISDYVELASFGSGCEAPKFHPSDDSACVDDSLDLSMSTIGGAGASREEGCGAFSDSRGRECSCVWRFTATDVDDARAAFLFNEKTWFCAFWEACVCSFFPCTVLTMAHLLAHALDVQ